MLQKITLSIFCVVYSLSSTVANGISFTEPPPSKLQGRGLYIGTGAVLSSVNIFRNYRENPYRLGFNARLCWEFADNLRISTEYNYTPHFNITPTWLNVSNKVVDLNLNFLARIKDQEALFYTISGICLQQWKGLYTGVNDFNTTKDIYTPQRIYVNNYLGLNLGIGIEKPFHHFQVFGEFKYRFSETESGFGITDAVYACGIKTKIFTSLSLKKIYRKLNDKYSWF